MASAWGSSWGASWGSSWGSIGVRGGDGFSGSDKARRRERRERYKRNRHPIIRDEVAEQLEVAEALAEIMTEVPEWVETVEEAVKAAVAQKQARPEPFDYAGRYAALRAIMEREAARRQDEEDIELLLLAA